MRTHTQQQIYRYIKRRLGTTVKEIVNHTGHHATGVFRHLQNLQKKKLVYKVGKPPSVRYYIQVDMNHSSKIITDAVGWATSGDPRFASKAMLCPTRDVFQARTDRLVNDLKKSINNDNLAYLLVAVTGEIGNNSFDHNLGNWQDVPGVYFRPDLTAREMALADRGQGIYATIKRVKPDVRDEAGAVRIAFTEIISGRAPEKRGNGLKFVKKIIEENNLHLELYTGNVKAEITASGMTIQQSGLNIPGTLVYLQF